ncbi:hypothetical protein QE152_g23764 [Popillia japonica]|uniref:Uncharacterized protein n=1 Tax=Popillia japonica TaxID=7064 RepID=A0AAW1KGB5_POPJA
MWGLENKPDNVNFLNAKRLNHKRLEIELKQKWPDLKTVIDNNEREVPFVQVFAVAQAREAAEKDYYENDTKVHKIKTKNTYENKHKSRIFILNNKQCKRCGKFKHLNNSCAAFSHTCKENRKGHFEKLCIKTAKIKQLSTANQSKPKSSSTDRRVHKMKSDDSDSEYEEIFKTSSTSRGKKINLLINNVNCTMDWDPGVSYSIISSEMWEKIGKSFLTKPPKLKAYGKLTPRGKTDVQVTIDETTKILPVVVIDNTDPMLFGLSRSEAFDALDTNKPLEQIIEENVELFNSSLGKIKNYQIKLHIKENAKPIHIAARPIKFGIQKNVEAELERLVKQGTISPVDPNKTPIEWATPTVAELERLVKQGTISPVDPNKTPIEWATPTVNVPKKDENQWSPAKVIDRTDKYSYKVVTNDGVERRRNADHIRERNDDLLLIDEPVVIDTSELLSTEVPNENQEKTEITTPQNLEPEINDFSIVSVPGTTTSQKETTQLRRSTRIRTIPRRYPK